LGFSSSSSSFCAMNTRSFLVRAKISDDDDSKDGSTYYLIVSQNDNNHLFPKAESEIGRERERGRFFESKIFLLSLSLFLVARSLA
jgi:hypothetical protein